MIYLLRKSLSQQRCSQPFPWCPVGQLDQPLIQGTTPNYATREYVHTQHRPAAVIPISVTETLHFAFLSTSPLSWFIPALSLPCGTSSAVGQSGSMVAWPLPYSRCHARVIRPHHEDICATLINKPVVLPLNLLPSHVPKFRLRSPTCSTAWRLSLHCSSYQIVDFTLWLLSLDQVLTVNLTSPSSRATINQKCCDAQSVQMGSVSNMAVWMFDTVLIRYSSVCFHPTLWLIVCDHCTCMFPTRYSNGQSVTQKLSSSC